MQTDVQSSALQWQRRNGDDGNILGCQRHAVQVGIPTSQIDRDDRIGQLICQQIGSLFGASGWTKIKFVYVYADFLLIVLQVGYSTKLYIMGLFGQAHVIFPYTLKSVIQTRFHSRLTEMHLLDNSFRSGEIGLEIAAKER